MYVRVTRGRLDPSRLDQQLAQELAATVKRLPGCQSYTGALDRASGQTVAISTWDSEACAVPR